MDPIPPLSPEGLTTTEARSRFEAGGPNEVVPTAGPGGVKLFLTTIFNPLTLILLAVGGTA